MEIAAWAGPCRGRDVLVEPEHVVGVVGGFDRGQALPCRAGVRRANVLPALVGEEADGGAGVGVVDLRESWVTRISGRAPAMTESP